MSADFPDDDVIARSKRILAMVDTYHERPDQMNRSALRGALMDDFSELLASRPAADESAKPVEQALIKRMQDYCDSLAPPMARGLMTEAIAMLGAVSKRAPATVASKEAVTLSDEEIVAAIRVAGAHDGEWKALTFDSGPYEITTPNRFTRSFVDGIVALAQRDASKAEGQ